MARAKVEAQDLYNLSDKVSETVDEFTRINTELKRSLARVQQTWQDGVSAKFSDEYNEMLEIINELTNQLEPQIGLLRREARLIEEYGEIRK